MKTLYIFCTILISLAFIKCDYYDGRLEILNQWNKPFAVEISHDSVLGEVNSASYYLRKFTKPRGKRAFIIPEPWPVYIQSSKTQRVYLFFFDLDTLQKYYNMEYIKSHKLYIKRMSFSEKNLEELNWHIHFNN